MCEWVACVVAICKSRSYVGGVGRWQAIHSQMLSSSTTLYGGNLLRGLEIKSEPESLAADQLVILLQ